jgi:AraC-like DNA-binding protein
LKKPLQDWPDSETLARELGMSRSTLHRRMKDAGLNLKELKDDERKKRAIALLANTDLSLSKIALELGYKEQSSFYRAFTRWFNETPSENRRHT